MPKNVTCKLLRAKTVKGMPEFAHVHPMELDWPSPFSLQHKWATNVPHSSWEYSCHLIIYFICAINNGLPLKEIFKKNSLSFEINTKINKVSLKGNDCTASNFKEVVIILAVIFSHHSNNTVFGCQVSNLN